ncbi:hypothetical protein [Egbenema bharatensis]|uniref:hypothetical protein n=1 Tax=Egbenema bharatensis TaxID=3463334 RepID=UPI003A87E269
MLISDLDQLEILSESHSVAGGMSPRSLSLRLADRRIALNLNQQQLLNETLASGVPITSAFTEDEISGLLTASYAEENGQTSRRVSLTGATDTSQFNFVFTSLSSLM